VFGHRVRRRTFSVWKDSSTQLVAIEYERSSWMGVWLGFCINIPHVRNTGHIHALPEGYIEKIFFIDCVYPKLSRRDENGRTIDISIKRKLTILSLSMSIELLLMRYAKIHWLLLWDYDAWMLLHAECIENRCKVGRARRRVNYRNIYPFHVGQPGARMRGPDMYLIGVIQVRAVAGASVMMKELKP